LHYPPCLATTARQLSNGAIFGLTTAKGI